MEILTYYTSFNQSQEIRPFKIWYFYFIGWTKCRRLKFPSLWHTTVLWKAKRNLHGLGLRSKMALGLNLPIKCLPPTEIPMSRWQQSTLPMSVQDYGVFVRGVFLWATYVSFFEWMVKIVLCFWIIVIFASFFKSVCDQKPNANFKSCNLKREQAMIPLLFLNYKSKITTSDCRVTNSRPIYYCTNELFPKRSQIVKTCGATKWDVLN